MKCNEMESNWNYLTPPNEDVEVMDEYGTVVIATPTYYPFKIVDKKQVLCEPYWDGWFITPSVGLVDPLKGKIIAWRKIEKNPE